MMAKGTTTVRRRFYVVLDLETEVPGADELWDTHDIATWVEYSLGKSLNTADDISVTVYTQLGDVVEDAVEGAGAFCL